MGSGVGKKLDRSENSSSTATEKHDSSTEKTGAPPATKRNSSTEKTGAPAQKRDSSKENTGTPAKKRNSSAASTGTPAKKRNSSAPNTGTPAKQDSNAKNNTAPPEQPVSSPDNTADSAEQPVSSPEKIAAPARNPFINVASGTRSRFFAAVNHRSGTGNGGASVKKLVGSTVNRVIAVLLVAVFALVLQNIFFLKSSTVYTRPFSVSTVTSEVVSPDMTIGQRQSGIYNYDVIVYGGTPSGIMSAVAAARQGLKVAVLEPGKHLGGIVSSGLGSSDVGDSAVIGGLAREFFAKVGAYYGSTRPVYSFEPHAAERVFDQFVKNAGVDVYFQHTLRAPAGVKKNGSQIISVITADGSVFSAKIFIDSSYEGDLMAASGVSYSVGREDRTYFNESLAGFQILNTHNNFRYSCPAFSSDGKLMPQILENIPANTGQGDKKLPAYNYRLCLTDDPANMVPFTKPAHYDPTEFKVLIKWLYALKQAESDRKLELGDILSLNLLPNRKFDVNNCGPVSTDYIGKSWAYPEADSEQRALIANAHKEYIQGLLYFLSNDPGVPAEIRSDIKRWGLAKDEFADNGNWPYQLYIRESRRMIGSYIMTQRDLQKELTKHDSIGMGSYPIDSHNVQRVLLKNGYVKNEGELFVGVTPYQIPYRSITPAPNEASNLLVTVCVSASHVAYSSLRMEPQYMIMGQAAGYAAAIAIIQNSPVQNVNLTALQALLKTQGVVLSTF